MRVADSILKGLEEAIDYQNGVGKARRVLELMDKKPSIVQDYIKTR